MRTRHATWECADGRPFIIDLESTNGTHVNDQEIPKTRYYELRNSDGQLWVPLLSLLNLHTPRLVRFSTSVHHALP